MRQPGFSAHRLRIVKIRVQSGQTNTKLQDVDASPLHQWSGRRLHDLHLTADVPQLHDKRLTGDIERTFERIPSVDAVFRAFADNMTLNTDRATLSHWNIAKPAIRPCFVLGLQGRTNTVEQSRNVLKRHMPLTPIRVSPIQGEPVQGQTDIARVKGKDSHTLSLPARLVTRNGN